MPTETTGTRRAPRTKSGADEATAGGRGTKGSGQRSGRGRGGPEGGSSAAASRAGAADRGQPAAKRRFGRAGSGGAHVRSGWRRHLRLRWAIAAVVVAVLIPTGWSYAGALTAPGNDSWSIRSVEWVRQHHGRGVVNAIENFWYSHHRPKKGGTPKHGLPTAHASAPAKPAPGAAPILHRMPPPITPIASPPLAGEGQWKPLGQAVAGQPAMYAAFLRPDAVHTSLVTGVAWIDPRLVDFVGYAGLQEPGGGPWHNQAPIPASVRPSLLAAFNSGFRMMDSRGGYYADGRTWRPLRDGAATLIIRPDGSADVGQWGRDFTLGPRVAFARQNLLLVVDHGAPVPGIDNDSTIKWGATLGNRQLVWRSGVGVTADGALVYAGGNGLSAGSLARVLAAAGAVRAMELDINSTWVDYFVFGPPGTPGGITVGDVSVQKLLPDMRAPLGRYLSASSRDFIAVFARPRPLTMASHQG